ncbi:porin family protein [Vibrio mexicanus]|uniref:porin family protein n=1 Tax=Vibrio mexicanus TaxID=1004326 RepID=UPI00063C5C00|nr:porin family protein [Vibrio mexicanus]
MKKTLLALALIGASATASADSWIYGGANVGSSDLGNDSSNTYGVHVGTGLLPFIGLEAGYQNHGEFSGSGYYNTLGDLKADSLYFAVKPSIDFGPLHVYAKAGAHSYDVTGDNYKEDSVDLMYGVGAEYFVFGPLSVGGSYTVFNMKHDHISSFNLNATLHFL